mgnify:CR=1 FL=1
MNLTWVTISVSCFCVFVEFLTYLLLVESMRSFLFPASLFFEIFLVTSQIAFALQRTFITPGKSTPLPMGSEQFLN